LVFSNHLGWRTRRRAVPSYNRSRWCSVSGLTGWYGRRGQGPRADERSWPCRVCRGRRPGWPSAGFRVATAAHAGGRLSVSLARARRGVPPRRPTWYTGSRRTWARALYAEVFARLMAETGRRDRPRRPLPNPRWVRWGPHGFRAVARRSTSSMTGDQSAVPAHVIDTAERGPRAEMAGRRACRAWLGYADFRGNRTCGGHGREVWGGA